jgi:hypothetical protein
MTSATKTKVETNWTLTKVQEAASKAMTSQCLAVKNFIEKQGPGVFAEWQKVSIQPRVQHLKATGVKTPFELVKAMAEFETNVFGSKINIWGDDKLASLEYESCACWNNIQQMVKMTEEEGKKFGEMFNQSIELMAKEFGFKGQVAFEGEKAVITFTK